MTSQMQLEEMSVGAQLAQADAASAARESTELWARQHEQARQLADENTELRARLHEQSRMVNEATAFLEHLVTVPGTAPPPGTARRHETKLAKFEIEAIKGHHRSSEVIRGHQRSSELAKFESEASKSLQCSVGEGGAGVLRSGAAEGSLRGLVQHHRNLQLELDAIAARAARHELTPTTTRLVYPPPPPAAGGVVPGVDATLVTTPDRRASRSPGSLTQTTLPRTTTSPPFSAYSASEPYEFQHAWKEWKLRQEAHTAGASAMVLTRSPAAPSPPPSCSEWRSSTPSSGTSGLQTSDLQSRFAEVRARRLSNGLAASPDLVASPSAPVLYMYASRGHI
jgi:hypothetical protein